MSLEVGIRGTATMQVGVDDTAVAFQSGTVAVLATPRLVALCEQAACAALAGQFDSGATTVGMRVQLDHVQPTAVGGTVEAEAVLDRVEGRRLTFAVSAYDDRGLVAAGKVTRVVVDERAFMERAR